MPEPLDDAAAGDEVAAAAVAVKELTDLIATPTSRSKIYGICCELVIHDELKRHDGRALVCGSLVGAQLGQVNDDDATLQ